MNCHCWRSWVDDGQQIRRAGRQYRDVRMDGTCRHRRGESSSGKSVFPRYHIRERLNMKRFVLFFFIVAFVASVVAAQSQVKKETVAGITNFARIETTVACAGAVTPAAVAEIKKMGFKS